VSTHATMVSMSNHTTFESALLARALPEEGFLSPDVRTVSTTTPWGKAQYAFTYGRGVNCYGCAGHGGFKLSATRLAQVHPALSHIGTNGWFEEDCEWAVVGVTFPELFSYSSVEQAISTLKNYWPGAWARFSGEAVALEDSYALRQQAFRDATADRWVAVAARGLVDGTVLVWAYLGGRRTAGGEERQFTVSKDDYAARSEFGYIVPPELVTA